MFLSHLDSFAGEFYVQFVDYFVPQMLSFDYYSVGVW